jgi:Uma2 family endonuclease
MVKTLLYDRDTDTFIQETKQKMPSLNHSYVCLQILKQLIQNEAIEPLPELTLDIDKGLTPDISVFLKAAIKPQAFRDIPRFPDKPILAIEVISSSQTIQEMLQKASQLVAAGINAVWTIELYSKTIFVTTAQGETLFHAETVQSQGIQVDFSKVFPN